MRNILFLAGGLVLAGGLLAAAPLTVPAARAETAPLQLAQATAKDPGGVLNIQPGDHVLGNADAPVTIFEYASLTCPHCAQFHSGVLPELKAKYIDTGKVKLVFRDFPLDNVAARAAMLAECAGPERYFPLLDVLFQSQAQWATAKDPVAELGKIGRLSGLAEADFKACMENTKLAQDIIAKRQGGEAVGVSSTPTLIINGRLYAGARPMDELEKILQPLLK